MFLFSQKRQVSIAGVILAALSAGIIHHRLAITTPNADRSAIERANTPTCMVYVPGGACLIGTDDADADDDVRPMRRAVLPSFYIDRTEVTNADYSKFAPSHTFHPDEADKPVTNVTYAEADAYAKWAGKRLPTEEEWEKAARGTDGRRYPWGNVWDPKRVAQRAHQTGAETALLARPTNQCRIGPSRVQPVGSMLAGQSPYGCVDMAGNAWEWVQGFYNGNNEMRILRGGAVGYTERSMRTYNRAVEGSGST